MKDKTRKLTKKQKFFVAEFLKDFNGSRAAIVAGYSPKRAKQTAYDLRYKTLPVKEAIELEEEDRLTQAGVEGAQILIRMARLGFADIRKLYRPDGTLLSPNEWPDDIVPAVAGVEVFEEYQGKGEDRVLIGHTKKVRLWDPNPSLTNMAKNTGAIGNGKHRDEDDEGVERVLTTLELSAKIVYLVKLAVERKKEIEGKKETERPKNAG